MTCGFKSHRSHHQTESGRNLRSGLSFFILLFARVYGDIYFVIASQWRASIRGPCKMCIRDSLETTVFVLSKALVAGRYDQAYRQLDLLLYQKEEPVMILAVLSSAYVDLYRVKVALESGVAPFQLSQSFPYKGKEFRLRNAERDVRNMSMEQLRQSLRLILERCV